MPRGRATVYAGFCKECNAYIYTIRVMKAKNAEFRKLRKYCPHCRKKVDVKRKEQKHSS